MHGPFHVTRYHCFALFHSSRTTGKRSNFLSALDMIAISFLEEMISKFLICFWYCIYKYMNNRNEWKHMWLSIYETQQHIDVLCLKDRITVHMLVTNAEYWVISTTILFGLKFGYYSIAWIYIGMIWYILLYVHTHTHSLSLSLSFSLFPSLILSLSLFLSHSLLYK